jgi:hypothetical protein
VWNHKVVKPVRIWSRPNGVDEDVLSLVAQQRFDELSYAAPSSQDQLLEQLRSEQRVARQHLNDVLDRYHERGLAA